MFCNFSRQSQQFRNMSFVARLLHSACLVLFSPSLRKPGEFIKCTLNMRLKAVVQVQT